MLYGMDLFSGIGGLTIALKPWVTPVLYCENDRYAQAVLLSRQASGFLPVAPIWDDVQTLLRDDLPLEIDILYGGFPCQDISIAGNGAGLEGSRSGLFFEIIRLVRLLRPRFVFLENVPAIAVRGLNRVVMEFTALRYDCRWTIVSATELGAPHLRERWFLLAHPMREGLQEPRTDSPTKSQNGGQPRVPSISRVQAPLWQESASDVCGMDDGLSPKTHRIRALGNAVVPLQARTAFERLMGLA